MSRRTMFTGVFLCIISFLAHTSLCRHAHRRPQHRHAPRADSITTVPSTTTTPPPPSFTGGDAVISDIEKIQAGFSDLPDDLLAFILALEKRLRELEKLTAPLIDIPGKSPVSPVGPVLSPVPPEVSQVTTEEPSLETSAASVSSQSATTSLCRPLGGAGPLRPCDELDDSTTTRTTRITLTMTSRITTTQELTRPTAAADNSTFPAVNATGFEPPAPWTKPYHITTSGTDDSTITYTFSEPISEPVTGIPPPPVATTIESSQTQSESSPTSSPTSSGYVFDATSEDNEAVYYGTTPATETGGLESLCANPNVDIVILSFLFSFFDANGLPSIDFGPGCSDPTSTQAEHAPGLKDCSVLGKEITTCQSIGKKVLLSLGGYNSNTSFTSDEQATQFADLLWDLFGAGTSDRLRYNLRPFGASDVKIDGFDIDNENKNTAHYSVFAHAMREKFASDPSKTYYLSAAPQCPIPDASIPLDVLLISDFVWVQFYNNPSCNIDREGFQDSFRQWSGALSGGGSNSSPRIYIGAGGFEGAGSGYVKGSGLGTRVRTARELYVKNLGGVMLWDGSEGAANVDQYGVSYLEYAKEALH